MAGESHILGKPHRQLIFRYWLHTMLGAVDRGDGCAPVALPGQPPILQIEGDGFVRAAAQFGDLGVMEEAFRYGAVAQASYAANQAAGDHYVQVVMENGVSDELRYRV